MQDDQKTKAELLQELKVLHRRVAELEQAKDITERKRLEDELRDSENRYRTLFRSAPIGIGLATRGGRILACNDAVVKMTGYSIAELNQINLNGIYQNPEDRLQLLKQLEADGYVHDFETQLKRKNGVVYKVNLNITTFSSGGEKVLLTIVQDITERKKAEEALKAEKERAEEYLNVAGVMIAMVNFEENITLINKKGCEILGYKEEELIRKNWFDTLVPRRIRGKVREVFHKLLAGDIEPVKYFENPLLTKDGEERLILFHNAVVRDPKGQMVGTLTSGEDITERKKAEKKLQVKTAILHNIISNIPHYIFWKDKNSVYLGCNDKFAKLSGLEKPEDVIGKTDYDLPWKKEESDFYRKIDKEVMTKVTPILNIEELVHQPDGKVATILTSKVPMQNANGEVTGVLGIFTDITERKRAEEALRDSENKYRTLVENLPQKIFLKDKNSVYVSCNDNLARDFEIYPEEIAGKTDYDLVPKELAEKYRADDRRIIESGETEAIEEKYIQQGEERIVHTVKTPVKDAQGKVIGILGIFWDITELKQTEEELSEYREKIAHAERLASLGTLSATLAHKLSSPLTAIGLSIGNSLAELETTSCPDAVTEDLKDGLSEVSNAVSIVDSIRNFARKSSEKIISEVNLKAVAERILKLLSESARRVRVSLHLKGMDELPAIHSDEKDLEQLFFALVENAIQAADGKKSRQLIIDGAVKDEQIELRFTDNCSGIAPENLDRIFEPFFTTRPAGEGTGLGLCIVEHIVSGAGGKVRVKSKPGEGSTFFVTLPINGGRMY